MAAAEAADPVHKFMNLIGIKGSVADFLANLSTSNQFILTHIPPLAERLVDTATPRLNAGAHGTILPSAANPKGQVWKKMSISRAMPHKTMNYITEAFIQHMLAAEGAAPQIHGIYTHKERGAGGAEHLYILMDRVSHTLLQQFGAEMTYNYNKKINRSPPLLHFKDNGIILIRLLKLLQRLWTKYKFVHRDLKSDNIMINPVMNAEPRLIDFNINLIDFGFSCITLHHEDKDYIIKSKEPYRPETECVYQQDTLSLFAELWQHGESDTVYANMDEKGKDVIESVIPQALYSTGNIVKPRTIKTHAHILANGTISEEKVRRTYYQSVYNMNGRLMAAARAVPSFHKSSISAFDHLSHEQTITILETLYEEAVEEYEVGGRSKRVAMALASNKTLLMVGLAAGLISMPPPA